MPIDFYSMPLSPLCQAVLVIARLLNIDLNVIKIDLLESDHLTPEFLKLNPSHTVPTISDNGFNLWESRAIMQYLCNQYAPDNSLYPKDPKRRALVDSRLFYDMNLCTVSSAALAKKAFYGVEPSEDKLNAYKDCLKVLDQMIGSEKYCTGDEMTIADISLLINTTKLDEFSAYFNSSDYPNLRRWRSTTRSALGDLYEEIVVYDKEVWDQYLEKRRNKSNAKRMAKNTVK